MLCEVQIHLKIEDASCKVTHLIKCFGRSRSTKYIQLVVTPILDEVLNRFNHALFAYGQTSTGKTYKTYTMEENLDVIVNNDGISNDRGSSGAMESESTDYSMKVPYIELYNEKSKDLLSNNGEQELKIIGDANNKAILHRYEEVSLNNVAEGVRVLK
ncbi:12078_t:CDS:2 [Entrophospora sp. SA101]|nr:12078_t:CDS:2 [Entrophospora sp. SA101]